MSVTTLTMCVKNGIIIHAKKFQFCKDTVDFGGLTITADGVVPSEKILSAITDFPRPTDLTSAHALFGLVIQVLWAYAVSPIMHSCFTTSSSPIDSSIGMTT